MFNFNYITIIQLIIALSIAFYLIRKFRNIIRATVVRLMPIKHRISDESFNLQTRISTLAAYSLGLLLTASLYWGINRLIEQLQPSNQTIETTEVDSNITTKPQGIYSDSLSAPEEQVKISEYGEQQIETILPKSPSTNRPKTGEYYIQLNAFSQATLAYHHQLDLNKYLSKPTQVIMVEGTIGPFKVIIGPFRNKSSASRYLQEIGLKGFVRPKAELKS